MLWGTKLSTAGHPHVETFRGDKARAWLLQVLAPPTQVVSGSRVAIPGKYFPVLCFGAGLRCVILRQEM